MKTKLLGLGMVLLAVAMMAAQPRTVQVGWDASTSTGIVSYNVYENTPTGTNLLGMTANLTFTINNVFQTNHVYAVTAVDVQGIESDQSLPLSVSFPVPPKNVKILSAR